MTSMRETRHSIAWAPRVTPGEIRRLYRAEAAGRRDEGLIDEVAYGLYARCVDILRVTEAHRGRATCPRCESTIPHDWNRDRELRCACGWSLPWSAYLASYQRKQLVGGGATAWVQEFVEALPGARSASDRMVLIDRLLHRYHWGMTHPEPSRQVDAPTRPIATNLVAGRVPDVLRLLDEVGSYGRLPAADLEARAQFARDREAQRRRWGAASPDGARRD